MLKIWLDRTHAAPEGWIWARNWTVAIQYIELYWQDQWERWYIDGIPKEEITNEAIISMPYYHRCLADWIERHPAAKNYIFHIHGEGGNVYETLD